MPQPSLRLITAGEKSKTFTDRPGLLIEGHFEGVQLSFTPEQPPDSHLIDLATNCVEMAKQGNFQSGMEVIIQSRTAIRGLLEHGEAPDTFRVIFLKALLESLDAIVEGNDPLDSLSLRKPRHRLPDPSIPVRNVLIWTKVGV